MVIGPGCAAVVDFSRPQINAPDAIDPAGGRMGPAVIGDVDRVDRQRSMGLGDVDRGYAAGGGILCIARETPSDRVVVARVRLAGPRFKREFRFSP
jgi:hypothetical protein